MRHTDLNILLQLMLRFRENISDLHFFVGRPPQVEVNGVLVAVPVHGLERLSPFHLEWIVVSILGQDAQSLRKLIQLGSADFSYSIPGVSRFRANVYQQRGTLALVMRVIPFGVPSMKDLALPEALYPVADEKNGIVLVTGPTGSGKSTTIAAIINEINEKFAYHIVTIEDPVEYLHRHNKSSICQRELGADTTSFASALRSALRQSPKVIVVGEMRDLETAQIALEAAETGHLVLSTLHTIDASKTIDRIIGLFPKTEEQQIRLRFAQTFKYVISQRLVPRVKSGRIAVFEILKSTVRTREYIVKGEDEKRSLVDAMNDGYLEGMQSFDRDLERLVKKAVIDQDVAFRYASNPNALALALQGGSWGDKGQVLDYLLSKEDFTADDIQRTPEAIEAELDGGDLEKIDLLAKRVFSHLSSGTSEEKQSVINVIPSILSLLGDHDKWKNLETSVALLLNRCFQKEADSDVLAVFLGLLYASFCRNWKTGNYAACEDLINTMRSQTEKSDRLRKQLAQGLEAMRQNFADEIEEGGEGIDTALAFMKLCGTSGAEILFEMLVQEPTRSTRLRLLNYIAMFEGDTLAPLIEKRLGDERWYVVRNMVTIMTKVTVPHASMYMMQVVDHQEPRVLKEILRKLLQSPIAADGPVVMHLLQHPVKNVRMQAVHLAGQLNLESAIPMLLRCASSAVVDDADLRAAALQSLLKLQAREAVPVAKALLERKAASKSDIAEKNAALKLLGELGSQSQRAVLEKIAANDSSAEIRTAAMAYLTKPS